MKKINCFILIMTCTLFSNAQRSPCANPVYRQFDFWVGEWEAFAINGKKAGDSKISIILDSCVVLEEWTSAAASNGVRYAGKSFNTYNAATNQWQQTWVDNAAGSNEYLTGKYEDKKIIFTTGPFAFSKDTTATRRLTFFNVSKDRVRQLGEITKDKGTTWNTEYDLEYRRKTR
jgi:hypothetical protein